ncbi:MAG: FAD-binding oxidoreductase [Bacteroidota bacterium]
MKISNWGNYPIVDAEVQSTFRLNNGCLQGIPRGMGRCYGDAALSPKILSTPKANRLLNFDAATGILTAEAGLSIAELLPIIIPQGWFLPVTPGTKFVSLGGAVAADVHGKNHHSEGSIAAYLLGLTLLLPSGERLVCSSSDNREIFHATIGGMGLTGLILDVSLQLKAIETSAITQDSYKARNLTELLELLDRYEPSTYNVAWIDCITKGKSEGRSLLMVGEHATKTQIEQHKWAKDLLQVPKKARISVPFPLPGFTLNKFTIGAFNTLYYHKQRRSHVASITDYDTFFYPLDFIHHWNRIYGKRGFTQYQLVIPREAGKEGLLKVLHKARAAGFGSFLAVLKLLGPSSDGILSFPMEGYTLTLDFPITKRLFPLLNELDAIVVDHGGRVYLAKDVRLGAETFRKMYPRWEEFVKIRQKLDPQGLMHSLQSQRLEI